jgi:hypothetical protein
MLGTELASQPAKRGFKPLARRRVGLIATLTTLAIMMAVFLFIASLNRKAAQHLQAMIDKLDAGQVGF